MNTPTSSYTTTADLTLQGLGKRTPDFLWISTDSVFLNPVFIEIERPDKKWLTTKGAPRHTLTQALHQLNEWEAWFDSPSNRETFYNSYQVPLQLRSRKWKPLWVLIYGRREEDPERVSALRAHLRTETRRVIPYEHLEPDEDSQNYLCVRQAAGRYIAVSAPPTVRPGPSNAEDWSHINGKEEAASASPWTSATRKQFLRERFPYWDRWVAAGARGIRRSDDFE